MAPGPAPGALPGAPQAPRRGNAGAPVARVLIGWLTPVGKTDGRRVASPEPDGSGRPAGEERDVREAALAGQQLGRRAVLVLAHEDRVALQRPQRVRMGGAGLTVAAGDLG